MGSFLNGNMDRRHQIFTSCSILDGKHVPLPCLPSFVNYLWCCENSRMNIFSLLALKCSALHNKGRIRGMQNTGCKLWRLHCQLHYSVIWHARPAMQHNTKTTGDNHPSAISWLRVPPSRPSRCKMTCNILPNVYSEPGNFKILDFLMCYNFVMLKKKVLRNYSK